MEFSTQFFAVQSSGFYSIFQFYFIPSFDHVFTVQDDILRL